MNTSMISTGIISVFLALIILGFIFGWIRGFNKSLTRFIMVICMAVIAFFTVPLITNALLNMDISSWNITIGEHTAVTLNELLVNVLRDIPIVEELLEASPTLVAFIEILPQMLVNIVLFVLVFFIFKYLSMIFYWIIAGVFFNKKKMQGKDKHNFIGAVIGGIQGLIVACLLLVPVFGIVSTAKPLAVSYEQTVQTQQTAFVADGVYHAEPEGTEPDSGEGPKVDTEFVFDMAKDTVDAFENTWVIKVLSAIGIDDLSVGMFDNLTTIEENGVEIGLRDEVNVVAKAYPDIKFVIDNNFDIENNEVLDALNGAIDKLYSSTLLSGVVEEVVPYASNQWNLGNTFCGIKKPTFEDQGINNLFNAVLIELGKPNQDQAIKNDLQVTIKLVKVCNNAGVLSAVLNDQDVMEVLKQEKNENFISDLIGVALESNTLREILPELINVAMDFVYVGLDVDPDSIDKIDVDSSLINWNGTEEAPVGEKQRLQTIFSNLFDIFDEISSAPEGSDILENLDFAKLGDTFDNIRFSELFSYQKTPESDPVSLQMMKAILKSSTISGEGGNVLETFMGELSLIWTDENVHLRDTFTSLQKSLNVVKQMQNATEFKPDDIADILETLTEDDTLKEVAKTIITDTETLKNVGLDDKTAGVVSETLGSVIEELGKEETDVQAEIEAVKGLYTVANKVLNNDKTEDPEAKAEITQEDANTVIESLAQSNVLLNTVVKDDGAGNYVASEKVADLGITENLDTNTIEDAINSLDSEEYADQIAKLNALFGTNAVGSSK